jgi:hypothetical protein
MGYYRTDFIGRGAAGAIRFMGLSGAYAYDPPDWQAGVEKAVYVDQLVVSVLQAGIQPGAMLQFWRALDDFIAIRMRTVTFNSKGEPRHRRPPAAHWTLRRGSHPCVCVDRRHQLVTERRRAFVNIA